MKLTKTLAKDDKHLEEVYTVEDISPKDIVSPSNNFLEVSRNLRSFSLNTFTIGEFSKEVQRRFTNSKP